MSASTRRKGIRGEQEVMRKLREYGLVATAMQRNEAGNADALLITGKWVIETKRQERLRIPEWWRQACEQTAPSMRPMLVFRQNSGEWLALARLDDLLTALAPFPPERR